MGEGGHRAREEGGGTTSLLITALLRRYGVYLWLGQRPDQVELLPLPVGVDGGALVVVNELVEVLELPLANAVEAILHFDSEVLVALGSFQGHAEVTNLGGH